MMARRITALLVIGSFWLTFAVGVAAPVPKREDVVKRAVEAEKASTEAIRSGSGVVAFETYVQEPEEREAQLYAKGQAKVYFKNEKYHFRFNYETLRIRTTYHDKEGAKIEEKIEEWRPDDLAIIYDGTKAQEITFMQRIRPSGCRVEIWDSLRNTPSIVNEDLTRLWLKKVGKGRVMNKIKPEEIRVTDLGSGNYRLNYQHKAVPRIRYEIDVSSKANYNPTRLRILLPDWDRDYNDWSVKWKKSGDVWYVEELDMTERTRFSDKPTYSMVHSVYRCKSFESNAKVDPQLFTLDCLTIPAGTRTLDRRPKEKR